VNSAGRTVSFTREGCLGVVTLNNPPLNKIGAALIADLVRAISDVEESAGLRAVVIRGEGDVFSAGADVALFSGLGAEQMRPLVDSFLRLGSRIEALPFPTLAAVHGTCIAGSLELALFCDLIWAAEGTTLGLPETTLGIVPLAGGVERVAARAGVGRARTIALAGGSHTAEDFAAWGVIDRVLPAADLHQKAQRFALRLADGPTLAYAAVKELTRTYTQGGVAAADALLLETAVGLFDTADARNGIQSYLDSGPGHSTFIGS
jgi:enoyl-CoA hydratase/carnithine racemase